MPPPAPRPFPPHGSTTLRVRYSECDPMGVAHHAAYAPWLEIGRTELLRAGGVSYASLEKDGVFLVIVRLEIRYRRSICYDDVVEVRTRVAGGGRVKIEHEYEIVLVEDGGHGKAARAAGESLAAASSTLACVDHDGKIQPLPAWLVPA